MTLPVNIDTSYPDGNDPSIALHQQHHDVIHGKLNGWVDVKSFGAVGDGATDDTAAIQACINAAPSGSIIFFPGLHLISSALTITKPLLLRGQDWFTAGMIRSAGGHTMVNVTGVSATGVGFQDLYFQFLNANASNIALNLGDGTNGCTYFTVDRCRFYGAGNGSIGTTGTGIRCNFALEGVIQNSRIEFFNQGIQLNATSNANHIVGCKIRQNVTGIDHAAGVDSSTVTGCTIEGNQIGVSHAGGRTILLGNHLENNGNGASSIDVQATAGYVTSVGNFYTTSGTNRAIYIPSGNPRYVSVGDDVAVGMTNNGTGFIQIVDPVVSGATAGTGVVIQHDGTSIRQVQGTVQTMTMSGYAFLDLPMFQQFTEVGDPSAGAANTGRLYVRDNGAGKTQLAIRFPTGAVQVIVTEP